MRAAQCKPFQTETQRSGFRLRAFQKYFFETPNRRDAISIAAFFRLRIGKTVNFHKTVARKRAISAKKTKWKNWQAILSVIKYWSIMPQHVPHAQCPFYRNDYTIPAANMQAAFGQVFTTYPGVSKTQNSYRKAVMKHNGEHTGRHVRQDPA